VLGGDAIESKGLRGKRRKFGERLRELLKKLLGCVIEASAREFQSVEWKARKETVLPRLMSIRWLV
jgi:hypothetical protein